MAPENQGATATATTARINGSHLNGDPGLFPTALEMFRKYDLKGLGYIDRTKFIQILTKINLPDVEWLMEASQILEDDDGNVDYNGFLKWIMFEDEQYGTNGVATTPSTAVTFENEQYGTNDVAAKPGKRVKVPPLNEVESIPESVSEELQEIASSLFSMALSLDPTAHALANALKKHAGTLNIICGVNPMCCDASDLLIETPRSDDFFAEDCDEFVRKDFDEFVRNRRHSFLRQQSDGSEQMAGFREMAAQILEKTGEVGSIVDDLQEVPVTDVKDKLAISYWRFCSGLRVYRSETVSKALRLICSAPVPGLAQISYLDVFQTLTKSAAWENHIYLFGGLVRDILRRRVGNDIDISFSAPAAELADICAAHGYTCSLDGDYILIGDGQGEEYLEGMVISFNGIQAPEHADFSMNTLFYDFKNDILIDKTGIGIPAVVANRCDLPCPSNRWKSWIEINGVRVCFRYYKFLLRGYEYDESEFTFVVKTLLEFWTTQTEHTVEVGRIALGNLVSSENADEIERLRKLVEQSYDLASGEGVIRKASIKRSRSKLSPMPNVGTPHATSFLSGPSWWHKGWLHLLKLTPTQALPEAWASFP